LSTAAELILGALAGALAQIFTIPVSVIATRQQVGISKSKVVKRAGVQGSVDQSHDTLEEKRIEEEQHVDDSFWAVGREIVREEGVTGLWLGIKPGLVLTVNPAITYGVYERVKSVILLAQEKAATVSSSASGKLTPGANFLIGALSKTLATVVTYPYIMAKVRIQTRGSDAQASEDGRQSLPPHPADHHEKSKHLGAVGLLKKVYRAEGLMGWYQVSVSCLFLFFSLFPHRHFKRGWVLKS
jgi:solute carrier family 25 (peroxisomal adenine nucleotide transporter), member 17